MTSEIHDAAPGANRWCNPALVAGLWLLATLLHVAGQIRFPQAASGTFYISPVLFLASGPVLAALVAAAIVRLYDRALAFAAWLLIVDCIASLCWLAGQLAFENIEAGPDATRWFIAIAAASASAGIVARAVPIIAGTTQRRVIAALATMAIVGATPFAFGLDSKFAMLSLQYWSDAQNGEEAPPSIDSERLWTMQPALVRRALAAADSSGSSARTYVVAIGAGGSQQIFGREARAAEDVLGRAFAVANRRLTLANDTKSLYAIPLATNTNLQAVLTGLGSKMNASRDLTVIYLTSHGSAKAELLTDLPNYDGLEAIGAARLARELATAGIKRRVIIVSACHAGSWIKPLATDDTIVIAAARADRSSFGCSDDRELTYFGEALLKGPVAKGASLADSFAAARRTVAEWEGPGSVTHSEPQAFVGRNMQAVWKAPTAAATAGRS
jgi:Peptidase C13 family